MLRVSFYIFFLLKVFLLSVAMMNVAMLTVVASNDTQHNNKLNAALSLMTLSVMAECRSR